MLWREEVTLVSLSSFPVQFSHFTTQWRHAFFFPFSPETQTQTGLKRKRFHVGPRKAVGLGVAEKDPC